MLARILRYPITSMCGEDLPFAALTKRGTDGGRGRALIDTATGHVVSAKHPRKWGQMLTLAARGGTQPSFVTIIFPDGREMCTRVPSTHRPSLIMVVPG